MTTNVLPAKSDSDIMFCLQSYQGLRIDRSLWIGIRISSSDVNKLMFYLTIVNKHDVTVTLSWQESKNFL